MQRLAVALLVLYAIAPSYAQTYEPALIPPQMLGNPQTTTPLYLGDDNTTKINLGFEFNYFGQPMTSAWISSNGFISFETSNPLCCSGLPLSSAPRNTIYGFWTDLISYSGNPYYRMDNGSLLVGWYNTTEYGTQNKNSFEIGLFSDGKIQFNFSNLSLSYHYAAAGITGPTWDDNIQLFFGNNPQNLQNQSGILAWVAPVPETKIDCTITPDDPSCPILMAPIQETTETIAETAEVVAVEDGAVEPLVLELTDTEAVTVDEPVSEVDEVFAAVEENVVEDSAERLSPDELNALTNPEQVEPEAMAASGGFDPMPQSAAFTYVNPVSTGVPGGLQLTMVDPVAAPNSPASVANTLEILNMSNFSAGPVVTPAAMVNEAAENKMAEGQTETLSAMASVPSFTAYTQVALQDRPDFYPVRDIYKNRRLKDAGFEMYRMAQTNDALWREMTDEQY